jgi:carboxypeptidase C (cathepsin A)
VKLTTLVALLALAPSTISPAFAQLAPDSTTTKAVPPDSSVVTRHTITVDGKAIRYAATTGNIVLRNDSVGGTASVFYVAYTAEDADVRTRPVTFVYNGGPGSASIWLHMGSFAPVRVATTDAGATAPAPYNLEPNAYTMIDRTDLVFVDAVGTGLSEIVGKGRADDFYGVDQDIRAFADFIDRYVTVNNRWSSPKFLMGESYGTTRSAGLASVLDERGMPLNGVVLISSWLDGFVDFGSPPFALDIPYILFLPTMAATAWYHDKLPNKPSDLKVFLDEVRAFAGGKYNLGLMKGARLSPGESDALVAKLHAYTGLPEDFIREANLRVTPERFQKELLRDERRTVGRLDARFLGIDHDAAGATTEYDAADAAINGAFTSAFNAYLRSELHYETDRRYLTSGDISDWDWHHRVGGERYLMFDVAEDLRLAMTKNPGLKVFSANGYFDFATPFFETEYTLDHMGLDPTLVSNISYGYYESGHMIYLRPEALAQLKQDVARFYDETLAR